MRDPRHAAKKPPFARQQQEAPGSDTALRPKADHGEDDYRGHDRLRDRVAIITGGDSGIGRAVAIAFAREGAHVAISHLPTEADDAAETCRLVQAADREVIARAVDLRDVEGCYALVDAAVAEFGRLDILVNNAAYQGPAVGAFEEIDAERIAHTFAVNIEAQFHITRRALPHMKEGATIINTASIQAYDPSPSILDYACTKAAIVCFTRGLASELIERGIRVNAVAPGPVWTPLIAQSFGEEKVASFGSDNPMERPAQPAELAPSYVFLASDESRFTTGEVLAVTGGRRTA